MCVCVCVCLSVRLLCPLHGGQRFSFQMVVWLSTAAAPPLTEEFELSVNESTALFMLAWEIAVSFAFVCVAGAVVFAVVVVCVLLVVLLLAPLESPPSCVVFVVFAVGSVLEAFVALLFAAAAAGAAVLGLLV